MNNPLQIMPSGQALLSSKSSASQAAGLGILNSLSHELLSFVFSCLEPEDCLRAETTSKAFLALCRQENTFKEGLIQKSNGLLKEWRSNWRDTYRSTVLGLKPSRTQIKTSIFSDVLYQPYLAASFDPLTITESKHFIETIPRIDARTLKSGADLPDTPCILTHAMDDWQAMSSRPWTFDTLRTICPSSTLYRAEAVLSSMSTYIDYCKDCVLEDQPVYLFESDFVEKSEKDGSYLGSDFAVPEVFHEDLFALFTGERPDYRWLIMGPKRSGSTFHKDPNNTSAWNAVVQGSKLWIAFPSHITPPGVYVSDDMSQVETPVSLAEWLMSYYPQARMRYGPNAKDPKLRNTMMQGICRAGECFHVPSGWWHLVINLEDAIAVTQNYVSRKELASVLYFMKHRPEQVSGFKTTAGDEDVEGGIAGQEALYTHFCDLLRSHDNALLLEALKEVTEMENKDSKANKTSSLWTSLKQDDGKVEAEGTMGFSFGFDV